MSILDRFKSLALATRTGFKILATGTTSISDLVNPQYWLTDIMAGKKSLSGVGVNANTALTLGPYYAALRNVSEDIGKTPVYMYQKKSSGRGYDYVEDHPIELLLKNPNQEMGRMTFIETLTHHAMGWGGGFAEIERNKSGQPMALHPIHPSRATVWRVNGKIVYKVRAGGTGVNGDMQPQMVDIPSEDMFHLMGLGPTGLWGYSILRLAMESIGVGIAVQNYGASYFGNGSHHSGVLTHPGNLSSEAMDNMRESWQNMYVGSENAHHIAILEEGVEFTKISIPPNEAQFLETRQFTVEDIARWFRLPPHKLGHLDKSIKANIEQQSLEHVQDCLQPWFARWEQEITRKLLRPGVDSNVIPRFNFWELLRGDSASRGQFYQMLFLCGALSPNDIREMEFMDPIPEKGGDRYFVQMQLQPLETASMSPQEQIAAGILPDKSQMPQSEPGRGGKPQNPSKKSIVGLHYGLFLDAARRVHRKEARAVAKARAKYKGNSEGLKNWAEDFYAEQGEYMFEAVEPIVVSCCTALGETYGKKTRDHLVQWCNSYAAYELNRNIDLEWNMEHDNVTMVENLIEHVFQGAQNALT